MLNHIVVMGRLTRDPELKRTQSGVSVTSFTVAVDRDIKGQDGNRETDFIDVVAWRSTAEFVTKYFHKGSLLVAEGRLQIREWTDQNGQKRRNAEIVADRVYFGESSGNGGNRQQQPQGGQNPQYPPYQGQQCQQQGGYQGQFQNPQGGYQQSSQSEDDGDLPF